MSIYTLGMIVMLALVVIHEISVASRRYRSTQRHAREQIAKRVRSA